MTRFVDLSHTVRDGMVTYRGLPAPRITEHLTREASRAHYAQGTTFHIGRIDMVANTGTYLDAPFHRFADGADLTALPLASLADLPGVVVRAHASGGRAVPLSVFQGLDVAGKAVLVDTGWSRHWGTETYFEGSPFLAADAAAWLVAERAALVGVDAYNVDDASGRERPVHTALLGAGIPVVEHLTGLDALPDRGFRFFAVPAPVAEMGTFPVRAFAIVDPGV